PCTDGQIVDGHASVRAERTGTSGVPGNGRVYAINFTATNEAGASCSGTVQVCVPHDQGDPSCVDDGQRYNSLGPCTEGDALAGESTGMTVTQLGGMAEIEFTLRSGSEVQVAVFDLAGRRLVTLENARLAAGTYQRSWDMSHVPNGVYFLRMRASGARWTKTLVRAQ